MLPNPVFGLWTYLFGVSNLAFDGATSAAPKFLRLDADSSCPLFEAMQKCAQDNGEKQKETWLLLSDIRSNILWDDNYTDEQRTVYTYEKLHGFFVRHPEWLDECANVNIQKGITIQRFIKAGKMFKQLRNLNKVIGGQPSLLIEYLSMLQEEQTLDATMREQIRMMVDNLNDYFLTEHRLFKRLEYLAGQAVELLNPQQGSYIEIDLGTWGKFDNLLECYAYYKKHGWHWNEPAEKSAHCIGTQSLIRLRSDNRTQLTDVIDDQWKIWASMSYRADFKGYLKKIHKLVEGREEGVTNAEKMVEICKILNVFTPSKDQTNSLMLIEIPEWGSVGDFCKCQQVPTNESI